MNAYFNTVAALKIVRTNYETELNTVKKISDTLQRIGEYYKTTENKICGIPSTNTTSNSTDANNNQTAITLEQIDQLMDDINDFMTDVDKLNERLRQALQDATDMDAVVAIGISGSAGTGFYGCLSAQFVVDMNGNVGIQFGGGTGVEAGASADGTAYVAVYPGMENIRDVEGFGTDMGVSFGEGFIGSVGLLGAGEGNEHKLVGAYGGVGLGGEATVAEGHIAMTATSPTIPLGNVLTGNGLDAITDAWGIIYTLWNKAY